MTPDVGIPGKPVERACPGGQDPSVGPAQGLSSPPGELRQQSNLNLLNRRPLANFLTLQINPNPTERNPVWQRPPLAILPPPFIDS